MPTPTSRSKILPARGSKANLDTALTAGDLLEGELCYAKDEDALYQVEGGVLIKTGGGLQPGDNVSELVNDAGYITLEEVPASGVEEAPIDGSYYVRQNGQWIDLKIALSALGVEVQEPVDAGNFTTGFTSATNDTTYDAGNFSNGASGAVSSETLEGGAFD